MGSLEATLFEFVDFGSYVFVVFLRVGTACSVLPSFGERSIPVRVRLVLAISLSLLIAISLPSDFSWLPNLADALYIFMAEVVTGIVFGLAIRFFVIALQTAGTMAAQVTSLSQIFGGASVDPLPALGNIFVISALAMLAIFDFHILVVSSLIKTYYVIPVGQFIAYDAMIEWGISQVSRCFALAFSLASPFILVSLVYNLALGVINKAMPQLMVALVGAPAITGGAIFLLCLSTPFILEVWMTALTAYLHQPFGTNDG